MKLYSIYTILLFVILISCANNTTVDPVAKELRYENPTAITINGYADDAMEPFISPDGNTLFFNSLNDGTDTKLYFATKVNAATFTFMGELTGANETISTQLNAVADMDALNNFYWTSVRDYPAELNNLHHGTFENGDILNIGRVQGDFYVGQTGWLVMDHGISTNGELLYYNNARFDQAACPGVPCETFLGIAQKVSNATFTKTVDSDTILQNINDPAYIYYAPCITQDNLELYYTRFLAGTVTGQTLAEICVATRKVITEPFSVPKVLFSNTVENGIVEAPTITTDKQVMYYHKKIAGVFKILMRERQ